MGDRHNGVHAVETENGYTLARDDGKNIKVILSTVKPSAQGRGEGAAQAEFLLRMAHERGGALLSGSSVSDGARSVEACRRRGYELRINPEAIRDSGAGRWHCSDPYASVFEIRLLDKE